MSILDHFIFKAFYLLQINIFSLPKTLSFAPFKMFYLFIYLFIFFVMSYQTV